MPEEFDLSTITFPEVLIGDAATAKSYIDAIQSAHSELWDIIRRMEEHIDGKKPKDPERLKAAGRLWANNWNYGKARAKIEKTVAENIDSLLNALMLMSLGFRKLTEEQEKDEDFAWAQVSELREIFEHVIAGVLNDTVDKEYRLITFLNMLEYSSTAWGWSAATKDSESDWMGKTHHVRSIGFNEKARPDTIKGFVTLDTIDASVLWKLWMDVKQSKNKTKKTYSGGETYHTTPSSYILEGLEECLFYAYKGKFDDKGKMTESLTSFQDVLPEFMRNSSATIINTENVNIAKIYTIELGAKKLTTTYIAYGAGWKAEMIYGVPTRHGKDHSKHANMMGQNPKHLLYQKTTSFKSIDDVITLVVESGFTIDGEIAQMRGLAKYAIEDSIRFNRKKNSVEDKLLFAGSPTLRKTSQATGDGGPKIIPTQGFTLISDGYDFVPQQATFDLSNHLTSIESDESHYRRETSQYNADVSGSLSSRPVTSEVNVISSEVQRTEGAKLNIKLRGYSRIFTGFIKSFEHHLGNKGAKLTPDAKTGYELFKNSCFKYLEPFGIDDEAKLAKVLSLIDSVNLDRAMSNADAIIEQLREAESPYKRLRLSRMLMLARGFSRTEVAATYPLIDAPTSMSHESRAALENNAFRSTSEIVFSKDQNHISDLNIHFPKIFSLFETIMSSTDDPTESFNWLNRLVEHSGFHIDALLKAPYISDQLKNKYLTSYKESLTGINQIKPQIEAMAQKLAEQEQQAAAAAQEAQGGQLDPKVAASIQNDRFKLENREAMAKEKSKFRADEMRKSNDQRRAQAQEKHEESMRKSAELAQLKKEIEILKSTPRVS